MPVTDPGSNMIDKSDTLAPTSGPNDVSTFAKIADLQFKGVGLPTADPHIPGAPWSDTGVTKYSAG